MSKKAIPRDPNRTERTVYFYKINVGVERSGELVTFPVQPIMEHLEGLRYRQRLVPPDRPDGPTSFAIVDRASAKGRLRLAHIRHEGLPQIEEAGELRDMDLKETEGLVEVVHLRFFEKNIMGAVFNFFGPRPARLARYLLQTAPTICPQSIRVEPLLRLDVADRLDHVRELRVIDLRVQRSYADQLARTLGTGTLASAFGATLEAGAVDRVEIVLRSSRERAASLPQGWLAGLRRLARRPDMREGVDRFKVKARDQEGRLEELDILRDEFLLKTQVPLVRARSRALDTDAAYEAIAAGFRELRADLLRAASVSVDSESEG